MILMFMLLTTGCKKQPAVSTASPTLHKAARTGDIDKAKSLIAKGADVNAKDENTRTPLFYAAKYGHKDLAELLIANGADINMHGGTPFKTPLYIATYYGYKEVVEVLLSHGAEVNVLNDRKEIALHTAIRRGYKEIVELLIKYGADVNIKSYGQTPLDLADNYHFPEIAEILKAAGAKEGD